MTRPPKALTPKELEEIEAMAGLGMRYEDIARIKGMCDDTLKKYAEDALKRGKAKAKAQVMQTAFKMAISGKTPAMTMFWLKTQCGWRENMPLEDDQETPGFLLRIESPNKRPTFSYEQWQAVSEEEQREYITTGKLPLSLQDPACIDLDRI